MEDFYIVQSLRFVNVILQMAELTAATIWAEGGPMKDYARTCLEIGWQIFLLGEFLLSVSKGTCISEETLSHKLPVPANFCLKLLCVKIYEGLSFLLGIEQAFWTLYCRYLVILLLPQVLETGLLSLPRLIRYLNIILLFLFSTWWFTIRRYEFIGMDVRDLPLCFFLHITVGLGTFLIDLLGFLALVVR